MTSRQGPLHGVDAVRTPPVSTEVNRAANAAHPIAGIGDTTAPAIADDGMPVHPHTPAQHAAILARHSPTEEQMRASWDSRMAPPEPAMPIHTGVVTPAQRAALAQHEAAPAQAAARAAAESQARSEAEQAALAAAAARANQI